jgi:hypothetical protein
VGVSNANGISDTSSIYIYSSKPYTLNYLSNMFGVSSGSINNSYDPNATTDMIIVLGNNWVIPTSVP